MILGSYTNLPNPTEIQAVPFSLVSGNITMGGIKMQKLLRYFGSDISPAGQTIRGFRFRLTWQNLGQTEINNLRQAHAAAVIGYVRLHTKDLSTTFNAVDDEFYVIADPENPQLSINWQQGYVPYDADPNDGIPPVMEGPVVYDAEALYLGATMWDS